MRKIHNRLLRSSRSYANWHAHPHHKKVHWGAFILVVVIVALLLTQGIEKWRNTIYNFVMIEFNSPSSVLTLDPKTKSVKVGESFPVNIILDTGGQETDGVDLYSIHYDPTILNVVDDIPSKKGVQIKPGTIMEVNALNDVNQSTGTIKFGQASEAGTNYNGKGVLAVIHFKAIAPGSTNLKFDFIPGNTMDTNVAHGGMDQLINVVDAFYNVTAN